MPRLQEDKPRTITLTRGDLVVTVGDGGDLSWADVEAWKCQIQRWEIHDKDGRKQPQPLSPEYTRAVVEVLRTLGGEIEDWRETRQRRWNRSATRRRTNG